MTIPSRPRSGTSANRPSGEAAHMGMWSLWRSATTRDPPSWRLSVALPNRPRRPAEQGDRATAVLGRDQEPARRMHGDVRSATATRRRSIDRRERAAGPDAIRCRAGTAREVGNRLEFVAVRCTTRNWGADPAATRMASARFRCRTSRVMQAPDRRCRRRAVSAPSELDERERKSKAKVHKERSFMADAPNTSRAVEPSPIGDGRGRAMLWRVPGVGVSDPLGESWVAGGP
jgi:hypothetical protein